MLLGFVTKTSRRNPLTLRNVFEIRQKPERLQEIVQLVIPRRTVATTSDKSPSLTNRNNRNEERLVRSTRSLLKKIMEFSYSLNHNNNNNNNNLAKENLIDKNELAVHANQLTSEIIFQNNDKNNNNNNSKEEYTKSLRIIHFNDVYNVEENVKEPKGGAARFITALNCLKQDAPSLVLFSGDVFSPSTIGDLTKGKHMIPILNQMGIGAACIGNHDFDFGVETLIELIGETNFPWLMSNCLDIKTGKPLAHALDKVILNFNGLKIGIIGLIEQEWIHTLATIGDEDVIFESYIHAGQRLADELRTQHNVDYVIALTHMRTPNDINLIKHVTGIDIFLGGHDHHYESEFINDKWIIKSGSDFKELSVIEMAIGAKSNKSQVNSILKYTIDSKIEEHLPTKELINKYMELVQQSMNLVLGYTDVDLDGRFGLVRTQECLLGNFITDLMKEAVNADCAILNSGSIRSDCITHTGELTYGEFKKICPSLFSIILFSCSGEILHQCLENSVSQYPKLEGRFLQVSGIQFAFDPSKPSGARVDHRLVRVNNQPLDLKREYKVATKIYVKNGRDGYTCIKECPLLIDNDVAPRLLPVVENYFQQHKSIKKPSPNEPKRIIKIENEQMLKSLLHMENQIIDSKIVEILLTS